MAYYLAMLLLLLLFSDDMCMGDRFFCVEGILRSTWKKGEWEMGRCMCREMLRSLIVS